MTTFESTAGWRPCRCSKCQGGCDNLAPPDPADPPEFPDECDECSEGIHRQDR